MILRKLNSKGILAFSDYLDALKEAPLTYPPMLLLTNDETTETLSQSVDIENCIFQNRYEAAAYLYIKLSQMGQADFERDVGLWSWLSLFYFDQLCPLDATGKRTIPDRAKLIPEVYNFRKYYRHFLAGPYRIYKAHCDNPERAMALLFNPVNKPGEIAEQIFAYQELVTNKVVMELVTTLYLDRQANRSRRGAAGKGKGSARRLVEILNQFDLTWDFHMMEAQDLIRMLPGEFERFRAAVL